MKPLIIGRLSNLTGCNIETIRYYERIGLLPAPGRSAGGHRVYGDDDVKRLSFVLKGRDFGFTIAEIRELLVLADTNGDPCADVRSLALSHLARVRRKLADLRQLERTLTETVSHCGHDGKFGCPVLETLSS